MGLQYECTLGPLATYYSLGVLMARDNCFSTEDFWNLLGALTQMHERSSPRRERPQTSRMSDRWLVHAERRG